MKKINIKYMKSYYSCLYLVLICYVCFSLSQTTVDNETYCTNYEPGFTSKTCCTGSTCAGGTPTCLYTQICLSSVCKYPYSVDYCYERNSSYSLNGNTYQEWYCKTGCLVSSRCQGCDPGYYNYGCGGTSNGTCTKCPPNFYCKGSLPQNDIPYSNYYCASGTYPCTNLQPCPNCGVSYYNPTCKTYSSGACETCPEYYQCYGKGSITPRTFNIMPKPCSTCPNGKYISKPCNASSDTECSDCAPACNSTQVEWYGCTPQSTQNRVCVTCSCPAGKTVRKACSVASDVKCASCSCPTGQYQTTACDDNTDAQCSTCTLPYSCSGGSYEVPCTNISDFQCQACTVKPSFSTYDYPSTKDCAWTCVSGYYRSNNSCLACSIRKCNVGEYSSLCTSSQNSECIPCTNKPQIGAVYTTNSSTSNNCDWKCLPGYAGGIPNNCTICNPGTFTNATGQTTCYTCGTGTFNNASGMTFCFQCTNTILTGKYINGCTGNSPGVLLSCTNAK